MEDLDLRGSMFQEPSGYFQPEQPAKVIEHNLLSGETLSLRLVGHNPLWVFTLALVVWQSRPGLIGRLLRDTTSGMAPKCYPTICNNILP